MSATLKEVIKFKKSDALNKWDHRQSGIDLQVTISAQIEG